MTNPVIYDQVTASDGTKFKVQETGMNWTLYVKEKDSNRWNVVQKAADAKFLSRVMYNQKETRKMRRL